MRLVHALQQDRAGADRDQRVAAKASRIRQREAERARGNRAEIVKARSLGQLSRRDLVKWGVFTAGGLLVCKNGLSPFARSAFAAIPTGTPRSPLFGAQKFTSPLPRLQLQTPVPMTPSPRGAEIDAVFGGQLQDPPVVDLVQHVGTHTCTGSYRG